MPRKADPDIAMHETIVELCREVKSVLSAERDDEAPPGERSALAQYRQNLEAGLLRLQGQWKQTLGDQRD